MPDITVCRHIVTLLYIIIFVNATVNRSIKSKKFIVGEKLWKIG